jgi:hypothetical protein
MRDDQHQQTHPGGLAPPPRRSPRPQSPPDRRQLRQLFPEFFDAHFQIQNAQFGAQSHSQSGRESVQRQVEGSSADSALWDFERDGAKSAHQTPKFEVKNIKMKRKIP